MIEYGKDLSCRDDFTPELAMSSGRELVLEAMVRRLGTPTGALRRHPEYGYDLRGKLSGGIDRKEGPARIAAEVAAQLRRDERVLAVTAEVALVDDALRVQVRGVLADGPFRLVLAASRVTLDVLEAA